MPKKIVVSVGGPENKTYFVEVKTPRLETKDGVPEPPPNFLPVDKMKIIGSKQPLSLHKPRVRPDFMNEDDKD